MAGMLTKLLVPVPVHICLFLFLSIFDLSPVYLSASLLLFMTKTIPVLHNDNGITDKLIHFNDKEIKKLIQNYTMESGVRNLERAIGSVCRIVAYKYAVAKE